MLPSTEPMILLRLICVAEVDGGSTQLSNEGATNMNTSSFSRFHINARNYIPATLTQIGSTMRAWFILTSTHNLKWHVNTYQLSGLGLNFKHHQNSLPLSRSLNHFFCDYLQIFATSPLLTLSFTPHIFFDFLLLSLSEM